MFSFLRLATTAAPSVKGGKPAPAIQIKVEDKKEEMKKVDGSDGTMYVYKKKRKFSL